MHTAIYHFGLAALIAALIPIVPKMVTLRIWILRKLHLRWFANFHEKYFDGMVIAVRVILAVIAVILIGLGIDTL
ncbi:MAG: hypothetical protein KAR42_05155 [candidate division Zixibacteria bacterium]|nr:hypothetical protein [candidate division Zixibacteria bacterium]